MSANNESGFGDQNNLLHYPDVTQPRKRQVELYNLNYPFSGEISFVNSFKEEFDCIAIDAPARTLKVLAGVPCNSSDQI